jgi:hypothetical protein
VNLTDARIQITTLVDITPRVPRLELDVIEGGCDPETEAGG